MSRRPFRAGDRKDHPRDRTKEKEELLHVDLQRKQDPAQRRPQGLPLQPPVRSRLRRMNEQPKEPFCCPGCGHTQDKPVETVCPSCGSPVTRKRLDFREIERPLEELLISTENLLEREGINRIPNHPDTVMYLDPSFRLA